MFRQWLTLVIIVLVYIPVAIDATVLHVAAPTLSMTLGASGNELLWIIDIYSLVMAGMVLPMGALGDRIGFKRLLILGGALFGLASLAAAFAHTASWLIATRAILAIGAAMIVPATLAGIRATFSQARHRNMALGVWAAVGSGGAAFGPLVGGMLLEHFYWGSVFLINVPIVLVVVALTARYVPRQPGRRDQSLNLGHAIMLIVAILLLVYSAKTALKGHIATGVIALALVSGALLLAQFVRIQLAASRPMIDMRLFTHRIILSGVVMAMTAMITLVGFELLMAQELQFVCSWLNAVSGGIIYAAGDARQWIQRPDCRNAGVAAGAAESGNRRDGAERPEFLWSGGDGLQHPANPGLGVNGAAGIQRCQRAVGLNRGDHGGGTRRESGSGRGDRNDGL